MDYDMYMDEYDFAKNYVFKNATYYMNETFDFISISVSLPDGTPVRFGASGILNDAFAQRKQLRTEMVRIIMDNADLHIQLKALQRAEQKEKRKEQLLELLYNVALVLAFLALCACTVVLALYVRG